jgi:hypothetical protein
VDFEPDGGCCPPRRLSILEPSVMTRRRLTIARLMAIIILIALGLTAFKYALRRPSHPAILFKRFALVGRIDMNRDDGIRPMPIERLLSFLDHGTGSQAVSKR